MAEDTITDVKKSISKLRSEVRKVLSPKKEEIITKTSNPFTGAVSGNYWSQTGLPWVSSEGRKAVLTEWFWQPIRGQPRRVDTNELRQFSQTFWIFSCVTTLLDQICSMEWNIVVKEGYDSEDKTEQAKKIKKWLSFPNANNESFENILRAWIKDVLELDAGCLVKVFDLSSYDFDTLEPKSGAPLLKDKGQRNMVEIYARDGASFLKETDKFGFVGGYWQYSYQIPAHPMWFNKDEICYMSKNPRSMSCYGYAPTQAVLDIVKALHYSTLYNKKFFEENSIPDGVLSILDTNPNEMKSFVDNWTREFKAQPHKFAVMNKDIKWTPFQITHRELEFLETQDWFYKLIIGSFGLTPIDLGITEDVNRATSASQVEISKRKGLRPLLKLVEKFINEEIISEFGIEGVEFQFLFDDPTELRERLNNWKLMSDMGLKTINEIRYEMGLKPVEWGDVPSNMTQFGTPSNNIGSPDKLNSPKSGEETMLGQNTRNTQDNTENKKKGVDDGQYYREPNQTLRVGNPPPQQENIKPQQKVANRITCPRCGRNTLTNVLDFADNLSRQMRCLNCNAILNDKDLIQESFETALEATPTGETPTKPAWSPK